MTGERRPPDLQSLFRVLADHGVRYVVTGSTAAMLQGMADVTPGDLDITPATDTANLVRLAGALAEIKARPDPDGPFGAWHLEDDGEHRWVEREAHPGEREARLHWQPDPADTSTFDHLLETEHGALDVVPEVAGRFDDLVGRAVQIEAFGHRLTVESIADQLATLTVPRRRKDRERIRMLRQLQRG